MSAKSIEKVDNKLCSEYFSFFNYKLYDSPLFTQEEKSLRKSELNITSGQTNDELSYNDLSKNINDINIEDKFIPLNLLDLSPSKEPSPNIDIKPVNEDIKPDLHKFILPKSLFDSGKNKINLSETKKENNSSNISNNNSNSIKKGAEENPLIKHLDLLSQPFVPKNKTSIFPSLMDNNCLNFINNEGKNKKKKEERKKKKNNNIFVKREGDWICYKCKNLNFAFRKVCNKCKLPKKESDKHLFDIGKELMKLVDLSIIKKSNVKSKNVY